MIGYVKIVSKRVRPKDSLLCELVECLAITAWNIERRNTVQPMIESAKSLPPRDIVDLSKITQVRRPCKLKVQSEDDSLLLPACFRQFSDDAVPQAVSAETASSNGQNRSRCVVSQASPKPESWLSRTVLTPSTEVSEEITVKEWHFYLLLTLDNALPGRQCFPSQRHPQPSIFTVPAKTPLVNTSTSIPNSWAIRASSAGSIRLNPAYMKTLSRRCVEVLSPFRSVDLAKSDSDLLPIDQDRKRVPVCDADNLAFEVAGIAQEDAGEEER